MTPTETSVFVIDAMLTDYKLKTGSSGDSDYHLVLKDQNGKTMVAEIPSPACVDAGSPFAAQIAAARAKFDAQLTANSSFQTANIPVRVTGVGFFDFFHNQRGAAPNVIELHPVLDIEFNPSAPGPDFSLSVPANTRIAQGGSTSIAVTATSSTGGTAPSVTVTASSLPAGVTARVTDLGSGKSTILLLASNSATAGTFPFGVTGTANGKSHTQGATLEVAAGASASAGQQWE